MNKFIFLIFILAVGSTAQALVLDWKGQYRFEWTELNSPSLGNNATCDSLGNTGSCRKAYGLNYLSLSPQIIAADGVKVVSKWELASSNMNAYRNSQMGILFGNGSDASSGEPSDSNVILSQQEYNTIKMSQLYLDVQQEYGSIIVGRAPFHYGLGMTYSAGANEFDHWSDIRDMFAYKFIIGNFSMMPILSRIKDKNPAQGQTMQEEALQLVYDSIESGSKIGVLINNRKADAPTTDFPVSMVTGATTGNALRMQRMNFILGKSWTEFDFKMEIASISGDTGLMKANESIKFNSYGLAVEMNFPQRDSKYDYSLKFGIASGDDPNTQDYEGFQFNRNYDVAFLLFNHRLGQADFLTSKSIKNSTLGLSTSLDDEAISNVAYIAPSLNHQISKSFTLNHTLIYSQLVTSPTINTGVAKDLGFEYDIKASYNYTDQVKWVNTLGLLLPGSAFENGSSGFSKDFTFGINSSVSVKF